MSAQDLKTLLNNYRLPTPLGFGQAFAPVMYRADYCAGRWQQGTLQAFGEIGLNPAATAVQFAQQAFEGMKAYQVNQAKPALFRPEINLRRLNRSAGRLCMPDVPAELFAQALTSVIKACQPFIPGSTGQSLYLRPTLLGTDPNFAVKSSENFTFLVLASPSDAYYAAPIKVMIERNDCRAALGGTGANKVGGNYGASLQATQKSIDLGYDQPLWLDPLEHRNIEELSGMNLMAVIDGTLHTPKLSGSILPGVTRDSLLSLARMLEINIVERTIPVDELLDDIDAGRCSELFATGTAAIICPLSELGEADGTRWQLPQVDNLAAKLKRALLDIQEGYAPDSFSWMVAASDIEQLYERLKA